MLFKAALSGLFTIATIFDIASACSGKTPYLMCCEQNDSNTIYIATCIPIDEMEDCVTPAGDTVSAFFTDCCSYNGLFSETCDQGKDCVLTHPVTCASGLR